MLNIYITDNGIIRETEEMSPGVWIKLTNPTLAESQDVAERYEMDMGDLRAALDEEESSRIDLEDGYTSIIIDIPALDEDDNYITIPLGILLTQECIITVCADETPILEQFVRRRVREFSTKKKMRFLYQILFRTASTYQTSLRVIDKKREDIEENIGNKTDENDLVGLHELETALVYFATSIKANGVIIDRLFRYKRLPQYPEDMELLEDVQVENRQAEEMTSIYRDIIGVTRNLMSSIITNRLNNVMKFLTSITLVMAIPTVISGFYGMNVNSDGVPLASVRAGFGLIALITIAICIIVLIILRKKKML